MHTVCNRNYATARMPPFWILFELRMMDGDGDIGVIRRAKLQSNRHHQHHQQTNTPLCSDRMPFLSLNQQRQKSEAIRCRTTLQK